MTNLIRALVKFSLSLLSGLIFLFTIMIFLYMVEREKNMLSYFVTSL